MLAGEPDLAGDTSDSAGLGARAQRGPSGLRDPFGALRTLIDLRRRRASATAALRWELAEQALDAFEAELRVAAGAPGRNQRLAVLYDALAARLLEADRHPPAAPPAPAQVSRGVPPVARLAPALAVAVAVAALGAGFYWIIDHRPHGEPAQAPAPKELVLRGPIDVRLLPPGASPKTAEARNDPAPPRTAPPLDYAALADEVMGGRGGALQKVQGRAAAGDPTAQLMLAKLYEVGRPGVPRDLALARSWTLKAAQAGERTAMHNLGLYLMDGDGGPRDPAQAAVWFRKAADAGVVDAQFNLAVLYEAGRGTPKNLPEAYRWFSIAANAGDGLARARAVALETKLTPAERQAAARSADRFEPGRRPADGLPPVINPASTVAETQKLLARAGYYLGPVDGADSAAFRTAAQSYLKDHPDQAAATRAP
jgi:localization factor PodJL